MLGIPQKNIIFPKKLNERNRTYETSVTKIDCKKNHLTLLKA